MISRSSHTSSHSQLQPFSNLMLRLGETFTVRDVMVALPNIDYVRPGDDVRASNLVADKRYSVVPVSEDGVRFDAVYCTERPHDGARVVSTPRATGISDFVPDATPLADALYLFEDREWYLTLR